jgi:heme-degrading monooxygenase HmoA
MMVLFLEVTLEWQDQKVVERLQAIKTQLETQPGFQNARLLENTEDPNVMLLESTWTLEMPEVIEGFPFEGLKCRRWSFVVV